MLMFLRSVVAQKLSGIKIPIAPFLQKGVGSITQITKAAGSKRSTNLCDVFHYKVSAIFYEKFSN